MDDAIRAAARAARHEIEASVDVDAEWQQFVGLARGPHVGSAPGPTPSRSPWVWVVAAAASAAALVGGIVLLRGDDSVRTTADTAATPDTTAAIAPAPTPAPGVAPSTVPTTAPTTASPGTTEPAVTDAPATSAPATNAPATTRPPRTDVAAVSVLDPPPELPIVPLATVEAADPLDGGYAVAIGDLGILVGSWVNDDAAPGRLAVVGFDGTVRSLDVAGGGAFVLAYGPGDVAYVADYGEPLPGSAVPTVAVSAVALSGPNAGAVVASTPGDVNRFLEDAPATYGHGPAGIVDRSDPALVTDPAGGRVSPYIGTTGAEVTMPAPPAVFTVAEFDALSDLARSITSTTGGTWALEIDAAPDRAFTFLPGSPPAPSSGGRGVYWTHIGPDAAPDQDYGEPTMWVIAELRPDGSASWWSVPEGWQVVASDLWGTVLARRTGATLELALADFPSP